ncbi:unnamed protein product [Peronospora destructor]|uniref:Rhodanese domain-containing protein n=1 Tax=Peronospora destructor TaxID=86335 RepID=A0AAV0VH75_9STRA|nr:unnamed protein product [Peronospora destructor]
MLLRCLQPLHCPFRRWVSTQSDCLESRQYVSLYNYVALDKSELPKLRRRLPRGWKALGVSGRIYLSPERINGQLILPQYHVTTLSTSFPTVLIRQTMFYGHLQSSTDTDEHHSRLTVKIWKQLMHDGFQGGELNVQNSGRSLPPEQWHHKLKVRNDSQDSNILVLDVRNFYEHEIGRFDGATRIMVDTFRDTFDALDEIWKTKKNEKKQKNPTGVFLRKEGVSKKKLHGGIVNYVHFLKEQRQKSGSACTYSLCEC